MPQLYIILAQNTMDITKKAPPLDHYKHTIKANIRIYSSIKCGILYVTLYLKKGGDP